MDGLFEAKPRDEALDPAHLANDHFQAVELEVHVLADARPLDEVHLAPFRRKVGHPDLILPLSDAAQRNVNADGDTRTGPRSLLLLRRILLLSLEVEARATVPVPADQRRKGSMTGNRERDRFARDELDRRFDSAAVMRK